MRTVLELPLISSQTAASLLPPALATTGNAWVVSALLAGETLTLVNVRPPLLEPANFTPPVEVA